MILSPEEYSSASTEDLLRAAARGQVGVDQRLVRGLVERGEAALPDFLRFLREKREDDRLELDEELLAMARAMRTPAALEFYAEYARQSEYDFPDPLTSAYIEMGGEALEALLALDEESSGAPDVRFALAALGVRDPRILRVLTEYLAVDAADAAIALGIYGDPAARTALEAARERAADEQTRRTIANAIEELDAERPAPEPEPFDVGEYFPEQAEPHFAALDDEELLEFLASPVAAYRARAVQALAFAEPPPQRARRILELAQNDPDVDVRAAAWEALEAVKEPPEIQPALHAAVRDETAPIQERAAALVAIAEEARRDEGLRRMILDLYEDPETRVEAVKAMWHSSDRRFEAQIPKALEDPNKEVVRQALTAAGLFGLKAQMGKMEALFEDEDLRAAALYGYALAAPSDVSPARMRKLFKKIEDLAGGLDEEEAALVGKALDDRLEMDGQEPVFLRDDAWERHDHAGHEHGEHVHTEAPAAPAPAAAPKVGRNDPCPCGSGKKYKKCCGA